MRTVESLSSTIFHDRSVRVLQYGNPKRLRKGKCRKRTCVPRPFITPISIRLKGKILARKFIFHQRYTRSTVYDKENAKIDVEHYGGVVVKRRDLTTIFFFPYIYYYVEQTKGSYYGAYVPSENSHIKIETCLEESNIQLKSSAHNERACNKTFIASNANTEYRYLYDDEKIEVSRTQAIPPTLIFNGLRKRKTLTLHIDMFHVSSLGYP